MAFTYKILTQNGVDNTNIDGARAEYFAAGMRDGIIKGSLNECAFTTIPSNGINLDTGVLLVAGHSIVITEGRSWTFTSRPSNSERRAVIAEIVVDNNSVVAFNVFEQLASIPLTKNNMYKYGNGAGTYQVEIGRFTLTTSGLVEDVVRTLDLITGGSSGMGEHFITGDITTTMLESGMQANITAEDIYNANGDYEQTNFNFEIPETAGTVVKVNNVEQANLDFTSDPQTQLNNKMNKTNPTGTGSFSLNRWDNSTIGEYSSAIGFNSIASGNYSHAEGFNSVASGVGAHAEGNSEATGHYSHAEGGSEASAYWSHAEGWSEASGECSHSEGYDTIASGNYSHAEGYETIASGNYSHAEGTGSNASAEFSHAEGNTTTASGKYSHAEGLGTTANHASQHVIGEFNVLDTSGASAINRGDYVEIVGNGTPTTRSNARTLKWNGDEWLAGNLTFATGKTAKVPTPTANEDATPKSYVDNTSTPIGGIIIWSGSSNAVPANFLLCDGAEISRTTYAGLFSIIGTTFGAGNSSTTFNVPNLVNRFPVGVGDLYNRGNTGGNATHQHNLSSNNVQAHISWQNNPQSQTVSFIIDEKNTNNWSGTSFNLNYNQTGAVSSNTYGAGVSGTTETSSNMPPYLALYYIIRAK